MFYGLKMVTYISQSIMSIKYNKMYQNIFVNSKAPYKIEKSFVMRLFSCTVSIKYPSPKHPLIHNIILYY